MRRIRDACLVAALVATGCAGPERAPSGSPAATTSPPRRDALTFSASPGDQPSLSVASGTDIVDLRIDVAASPQFVAYDARLRDHAREEVWLSNQQRPLAPATGTLIVSVPASVLKPGRYDLTVLGRNAEGRRVHFADLSFTVR